MADRPATSRKKPGRKRRAVGWVLVVIGVLITGVWGASRWWEVGYVETTWNVSLCGGRLGIMWDPATPAMASPNVGWWLVSNGLLDWWWWVIPKDHYSGSGAFNNPGVTNPGGVNLRVIGYLHYTTSGSTSHLAHIIPWPFALASLLGGWWLVWSGRRARRRAMTGVCRKCEYDLSGLATGSPCPECGNGSAPTSFV